MIYIYDIYIYDIYIYDMYIYIWKHEASNSMYCMRVLLEMGSGTPFFFSAVCLQETNGIFW